MTHRDTLACWILPCVLCLLIYWPGLRAWFQQDDFAWLGLSLSVHSPADLPHALFSPMAQGTIRPLSERAFFLLFHALFGVHVLPYRIWVFLTQFAGLAVLGAIARRVTGSRLAGFLAPVFWVVNSGMATTLAWTSAYNQVLCAFFVLLAFYCLLRHIDTGERRWLLAEWAAFAAGLGSLETAIMFPLLAVVYTWLFARKHLRGALPFVTASALYGLLHYLATRHESSGRPYALHFGWSLLPTLGQYWQMALGPANVGRHFGGLPTWPGAAGTWALTAGILGFSVWRARRCQWVAVFGLAWFVLMLAPVLPLRDHVSSYYLTVPAAGLALAGAYAAASGWRSLPGYRALSVVLAAIYLVSSTIEGSLGSFGTAERSWRVRTALLGARAARAQFPRKKIVLAGVDSSLFWAGIFDHSFDALGLSKVYLEPGTEDRIEHLPGWQSVSELTVGPGDLRLLIESGEAVVYAVEPRRLRGATTAYLVKAREEWQSQEPGRVDVGDAAFAGQLGPTWSWIEDGRRWMPKRATVRLRGPRSRDERLYVSGWCPPQQAAQGALLLTFTVGGHKLPGPVELYRDKGFRKDLQFPPEVIGNTAMDLAVEVDRTFRAPGDSRDLGLVFGTFEIRR